MDISENLRELGMNVILEEIEKLQNRVNILEGMLKTYFEEKPAKRIYDMEQRLSKLERQS